MSRLQNLRGDLFGGFTAAVVALPLALAFGVASGAGALAGLYGAIAAGFFAAVFGGTPVQISGPTGPMTVAMALVVTHFANEPGVAFTVVILAGLLQVGFGVAGVGRYVKLVPMPVVSGFMTGIGVIIIILQLAPLLGHVAPDGPILIKLSAVPAMLARPDFAALALGALALATMVAMPKRLAVFVPPPLAAIAAGIVAATLWFGDAPAIGPIPSGLPELYLPTLSMHDVPVVVRFALILAFLGSIDSLLTSLVVDSISRKKTRHDSNRELIGQGIGNVAAGLVGGLPGAGATMRTLVNVRAGGNSRVSGALHAVVLLAIVLGFGEVASHIPLAVLGGILLKVGFDIIDWRYLKRLRTAPRAGVVIMLTTLLITVFVDLMTAVAVGFVMAACLFVARMADAQMQSARLAFGADDVPDLLPEEADILERADGRIVLFHVEGPLSFGSARGVAEIMQKTDGMDVLVIDLSDVPFIDSSASITLEEVIQSLRDNGDSLLVFGARERVVNTLRQTQVLRLLGTDALAATRLEALRRADAIAGRSARERG